MSNLDRYKFRGKRIDNGEWVYGCLDHHGEYAAIHCRVTLMNDGEGALGGRTLNKVIRVDPATVGQWTGLQDKNGVDIYEGDILTHSKFGDAEGGVVGDIRDTFRTNSVAYDSYAYCGEGESLSIIIGNIHDKPPAQ